MPAIAEIDENSYGGLFEDVHVDYEDHDPDDEDDNNPDQDDEDDDADANFVDNGNELDDDNDLDDDLELDEDDIERDDNNKDNNDDEHVAATENVSAAAATAAASTYDPDSLFLHADEDTSALLSFFADDLNYEEEKPEEKETVNNQ